MTIKVKNYNDSFRVKFTKWLAKQVLGIDTDFLKKTNQELKSEAVSFQLRSRVLFAVARRVYDKYHSDAQDWQDLSEALENVKSNFEK